MKTRLLLLAALCTVAAALARPDRTLAQSPLLAAYEEADITPPLGGSMPGYFGDRKSTGVLDPLKSKVLYLRQGDESVAIVACDLIGVGAPLVERIRGEVRRRARPAPDDVWVHATHTHTGAMVPRAGGFTSDTEAIYPQFYPGVVDEQWVATLVNRTADAVARAARNAKAETALTLHEGRAENLAFYRRFLMKNGTVRTNPGRNNPEVVRPAGEVDPRVHVLRFADRKVLGVVYGLHPDCVSGTQYSADYPHHLTEALREQLGPEWRVIFLNACCGNINHINVSDPNQRSGPEESRRIGRTLADAVGKALKRGEPLTGPLEARRTHVTSRLRRPTDAEMAEAEERLRTGRDPFQFNGLFAPAALVLGKTQDREHQAEISALRLGSFGLAAVPGEYFVELGREIEGGSPLAVTRTIGLTNGSMGYIPHRKGYEEGGYEAGYRSARYQPDTGHRWAAAAARLLKETAR